MQERPRGQLARAGNAIGQVIGSGAGRPPPYPSDESLIKRFIDGADCGGSNLRTTRTYASLLRMCSAWLRQQGKSGLQDRLFSDELTSDVLKFQKDIKRTDVVTVLEHLRAVESSTYGVVTIPQFHVIPDLDAWLVNEAFPEGSRYLTELRAFSAWLNTEGKEGLCDPDRLHSDTLMNEALGFASNCSRSNTILVAGLRQLRIYDLTGATAVRDRRNTHQIPEVDRQLYETFKAALSGTAAGKKTYANGRGYAGIVSTRLRQFSAWLQKEGKGPLAQRLHDPVLDVDLDLWTHGKNPSYARSMRSMLKQARALISPSTLPPYPGSGVEPSKSSYSSMLPPTPAGGWPQNSQGEWNPDTPAGSAYSSYSSMLPPTPAGGWPQNSPGEWNPDTPAGSSYCAWPGQPEASSSTFDDLESLDSRQNYSYREFDLTPPQEIGQPGWWQHATPAQSTDSTFGGLSSMSHYGREFDLNTPQEEEEPWDYGTQTPLGHSAMSPERIDVDNLPSPQDVPDPELPPVTATSWLQDGHLRAYTDDLARRLQGQPNAHLLHFADSQTVTMLSSTDPDQQARAQRRLVGDNVPPIVFLPINQPNFHWSLLVVDRRNKDAVAAYYYDSMAQTQQQQRYLADMAAYHLGLDYEETREMPTAVQPDGYSCGDHVLTGIEMLAHRVIDGTFDDAGGRDLRDIEPNRGLIRNRLAQAAQAPAESSVRSVPERPSNTRKRKASGGSSSNSTIGDRGSAAIR